jgi:hypothetical protein
MTPSPSPQSEFLEQKLENNLIESTVCLPSPFAIERAFNPQERGSIVLSTGRATEQTNPESSMSSDGKANAASEGANLKRIWDDTMKEFGVRGKCHQDTSVLMISFANKFDDLDTKAEVDELETVFKDLYHYQVIRRELSESGNQTPTRQLSRYLLELVDTSRRDTTLLIVYYAGHGIPGKPGELHLAGYGTCSCLLFVSS